VKFIVEEMNLILAGMRLSRSSSWRASGRLVGRTLPPTYYFSLVTITISSVWATN